MSETSSRERKSMKFTKYITNLFAFLGTLEFNLILENDKVVIMTVICLK